MPINETKQLEMKNNLTSSLREGFRKANGTRLGTAYDWREGSGNAGKKSSRHGQTIRDGR
jgi:hypothetical protein